MKAVYFYFLSLMILENTLKQFLYFFSFKSFWIMDYILEISQGYYLFWFVVLFDAVLKKKNLLH